MCVQNADDQAHDLELSALAHDGRHFVVRRMNELVLALRLDLEQTPKVVSKLLDDLLRERLRRKLRRLLGPVAAVRHRLLVGVPVEPRIALRLRRHVLEVVHRPPQEAADLLLKRLTLKCPEHPRELVLHVHDRHAGPSDGRAARRDRELEHGGQYARSVLGATGKRGPPRRAPDERTGANGWEESGVTRKTRAYSRKFEGDKSCP